MNNEFEFPYVHIEHVGQHLANSWSTMFNKIGPSFNNMSNVGDIYGFLKVPVRYCPRLTVVTVIEKPAFRTAEDDVIFGRKVGTAGEIFHSHVGIFVC